MAVVPAAFTLLTQRQLESDSNSRQLVGADAGSPVSLILVEMPPGGRVRLHRHAYAEVFVVHEGRATYRVGDDRVEVWAGQVVVVPAGTPHGFENTGDVPLRQTDIHCSDQIVTEWLEA